MPTIVWILIVLLVGAGGGFAGYTYRQKMVEEKINRSEETAKRLYEDALSMMASSTKGSSRLVSRISRKPKSTHS